MWASINVTLWLLFTKLASSLSINDCPAGVPRDIYLQVYGEWCFQFVVNRRRTHYLAKADCESNGGTLALVKSVDIQTFLYRELLHTYQARYAKPWIGLNDIDTEGVYRWEDGAAVNFTAWNDGQGPDSTTFTHGLSHDKEDCVVIDVDLGGNWAEYVCEETTYFPEEHPYICQFAL